jgi:choloylglycine hydrolase
MKKITLLSVLTGLLMLAGLSDATACTIFRLKAKDGTITIARSMEFGVSLNYDMIVVPRNLPFVSPSPVGKAGMRWTSKFGYAGVASMGLDFGVSDGMNEKGLSVSILWYENDMQFQTVAPADSSKAMAQVMYPDWILGNCSTVAEVKAATPGMKIFAYSDTSKMKMPVTVHFIIYDAQGGCIVVEFDKGICSIYDNPMGIMTNAPSFPWQTTNLRQYIGFENTNPPTLKIDGLTFNVTGHGEGMIGIPGDYTPPSRFVRLAMFERFVTQQPDAATNLNLCQHVINTFSIPFGIIVDKDATGKIVSNESTQWVTFRDITNRIFYFKTYENPTIRRIDFSKLDFSAKAITRIPMYGTQQTFVDVAK